MFTFETITVVLVVALIVHWLSKAVFLAFFRAKEEHIKRLILNCRKRKEHGESK